MKYTINSEQDLINLKQDEQFLFEKGDIIVHKPFEYYTMVGLIKKHFGKVELFPAGAGTSIFAINGYNTSVIKKVEIA